MTTESPKLFRLRSFVRRDGRRTPAQVNAFAENWPRFGLQRCDGSIDYQRQFSREAPRFLEIGFGMGQSLVAIAAAHPERDFIGVETHKPGVGALLLGVQQNGLTNLRVYYDDVVDVIEQCIPDASLNGIQIFFPDPWQKRRHHARRLIQPAFVKLLASKLKAGGELHLATDWEDYALHMMKVMSGEASLSNRAGVGQFSARSVHRPILTKFERRAEREGRSVWELQFCKV